MSIRRKRIRELAAQLLKQNGVVQPPVPVDRIARSLGLSVRKRRNASSDISGFIFRRGRGAVIGVNSSNARVRQRFTIAHELGHYLFHTKGYEKVHVDRQFEVKFRDGLSSQGIDTDEREANLFAAELLMPQPFIARDIAALDGLDIVDGNLLKNLARRYQVSAQAMLFRLANLGYVSI